MSATQTATSDTPVEQFLAQIEADDREVYGCPSWCRLECRHHCVDLEEGRAVVDHNGPDFGGFVSAVGVTFAESQEIRDVTVRVWTDLGQVEMTPETLRALDRRPGCC